MSTKFDIGDLEHDLAALSSRLHLKSLAIVVPLAPGMRELPPTRLPKARRSTPVTWGSMFHQVLLTDREAIFLFGLEVGAESLERILASDDFWGTSVGGSTSRTGVHRWRTSSSSSTRADVGCFATV